MIPVESKATWTKQQFCLGAYDPLEQRADTLVSRQVKAGSKTPRGSYSEIVHTDQERDERGSDSLQVDHELADCDIAGQVFPVDPSEGMQKVAQLGPKAPDRVHVYLEMPSPSSSCAHFLCP